MTKETKYINLADFKAVSEGPGGWEGYLSKFGELDDGGDIVLQGAYTDTIPQFLSRGFNAESHDWTFSRLIGFPTKATEDKTGLYTVSQYHSTPDAQLVRTKAQERIAAGMGVYMSIGYEPTAPPVFIFPKDYAEQLPQYSSPELVQQNLAKATKFARVRVLPKVELYEGSIVSLPMLRSAEVTSVKSAVKAASHKGAYEDELAEMTNNPWNLWCVFCSVLEDIQEQDEAAETLMLPFDFAGNISAAVDEFAARLKASIIAADIAEDTNEDQAAEEGDDQTAQMGMPDGMGYSGRNRSARKNGLVDGSGFAAGLHAVADAARSIVVRAEKRADMRTKEGRVLSAANMSELDDLKTQLATLASKLEKLLAGASPKPKEGSDNAEKEKSNQLIQDAILAMVRRDTARRGVTTR